MELTLDRLGGRRGWRGDATGGELGGLTAEVGEEIALLGGGKDGAVTGHPEERKALGDAAQHGGIVAAVKPAVVEQAGGAFAGELRAVAGGAEGGDDGFG